MAQNYYDRLGVGSDASTAEIKQAYRERLKETHPDVSDEANAGDRTKKLIEARDVLTDETERERYDRLGHDRYVEQETGSEVTNASDGGTRSEGTDADADETTTAASGQWSTASNFSNRHRQNRRTARNRRHQKAKTGGSGERSGGRRHRHRQRAPHDSWRARTDDASTDGRSSETQSTWRAWDTDAPYSLRDDGLQRSRLFPTSQSVVLLTSTFVLYPMLLWGALLPAFPLAVNVVLAACLLGIVTYLQSIPEVGIAVFGLWSVLLPAVIVVLEADAFALPWAVALLATVLPFGFSVLTRAVVRT